MTDTELLAYSHRLTRAHDQDPKAPAAVRFWSMYLEVPGAIAFGKDAAAAKKELESSIVPFLMKRLANGGTLPAPIATQSTTSVSSDVPDTFLQVSGILIGTPADLSGGLATVLGTTELRGPVAWMKHDEVAA